MANLRSAYAECAAEVLTVDTATYTSVYKKVILSKLQLVGHLQNQNQLVQLLRLIFLTLL